MRWWLRVKQQLRTHASLRMHQQNEALESSSRPAFKNFAMGWHLMVKNNVTGSPQRWGYWVRIPRTKERNFGWESGVTDELWHLPTSSPGVCFSWFPWPACPPLGFPVCFVVLLRIRGFWAPNLWTPHQQTACVLLRVFFSFLSSSQDSMHCTLSLTVGLCTRCQ